MAYHGPTEYKVWHSGGKRGHWAGGKYDSFRKLSAAKKKAQAIANKTGKQIQIEKYWDVGLVGEYWIEPKHIQQSIGREFNPGILSKLRKGIRGHIKLSRGRLIIKT